MKKRINQLLNVKESKVWASTFHSLGTSILYHYANLIGYSRNFTILSPSKRKTILKHTIVKGLNKSVDKDLFYRLKGDISKAKENLMLPNEFMRYQKKHNSRFKYNLRWKDSCKGYKYYQRILKANQAFDFDDLIMLPVLIFKSYPRALQSYQKRFIYISVDEYQDTNQAQYEMVNLIAKKHRNICVVGDVDQSIYGWRGANIHNILNFSKDYPDDTIIKMQENYRSTKNILTVANSIIRNNPFSQRKHLWTRKGKGKKIQYNRSKNQNTEAKFVANKIKKLVNKKHLKYNDFVILYRVNAQSRAFEDCFVKQHIPYQIIGGIKYYNRAEIRDILAYLSVVHNPNDNLSYLRIINKPKRHIGKESIRHLQKFATKYNGKYLKASVNLTTKNCKYINKKVQSNIKSFAKEVLNYHNNSNNNHISLTELTKTILNNFRYLPKLKEKARKSKVYANKLQNVMEFFTVTSLYDKKHPQGNLSNFLSQIALLTGNDMKKNKNQVSLMTVHSVKGLEFPIVFLVGMEENTFPMFYDVDNPKKMHEERRLAYVAVTRAEKELFITNVRKRMLFGFEHQDAPSEFVKEIEPKNIINKIK